MPIFAQLVLSIWGALVGLYSTFFTYQTAVKWARITFVVALTVAWLVAVKVCLTALLGAANGATLGSMPSRVLMGFGMFIPPNAAAILACMGAVWLGCFVFRLKLLVAKL